MTRSPISASPLRQIDLRFTIRKFTPLNDEKAELCPTVFFSRNLSLEEKTGRRGGECGASGRRARIGAPCQKADIKVGIALSPSPLTTSGHYTGCVASGRLYDVERWIAEGKPLQLTPEAIPKGTRPKTALQIALKGGQHSLAFLLLSSGFRLELERYAPLDRTLQARRWDLVDLLVEWGRI
jgi:hypothetical protein